MKKLLYIVGLRILPLIGIVAFTIMTNTQVVYSGDSNRQAGVIVTSLDRPVNEVPKEFSPEVSHEQRMNEDKDYNDKAIFVIGALTVAVIGAGLIGIRKVNA